MNRAAVERIAEAVLYEGYILYPYRPSVKNRQRWTFGGLYPGIGLEAQLSAAEVVHRLVVTSGTVGWAASVYLSTTPIPQGDLAGWGAPVSSLSGIDGSATFTLDARRAEYVLLWLTNLGPASSAAVSELTVS